MTVTKDSDDRSNVVVEILDSILDNTAGIVITLLIIALLVFLAGYVVMALLGTPMIPLS